MNVLVLTDLSEVAKNAGSYAVQFLKEMPVKFYLLNIKLFHPAGSGETNYTQELALKKLKTRVEELKKISENTIHEYEVIYLENDLLDATRKVVDEKKIDLIVMGAAHKGHSPHTFIGNHTYEIIRKIKCNILAVAENCKFKPPEKIIFPIDPVLPPGKPLSFLNLKGIAPEAKLTIVELLDLSSEVSETRNTGFLNKVKKREVEIRQLSRAEAFSEAQLLEVQKKFDLIILLARNITICDELLHTKQGLYSIVANNLPILVLHN